MNIMFYDLQIIYCIINIKSKKTKTNFILKKMRFESYYFVIKKNYENTFKLFEEKF